MVSRLIVALRGDLKRLMRDERIALERGGTSAIRRVAAGARTDLRRQVRSAFTKGDRGRLSGAKLEDAVRSRVEPRRGYALNPVGRTYSKAVYAKRPGGAVDLLALYDEGGTITAAGGGWLAIPTSNAPIKQGRGGARRARPSEVPEIRFRFIPISAQKAVLVDAAGKVAYVLVKSVRYRKRLDINAVVTKWAERISDEVVRSLAREDEKLEAKYQ